MTDIRASSCVSRTNSWHLRLACTVDLDASAPGRQGECVRYIEVLEVPSVCTIAAFVLPPSAALPLHDHPGMTVVSKMYVL